MDINVVLLEPEIPQNTGNIARTCVAVGAKLHLIKPLGFEIEDKYLKRAGMDYWNDLDLYVYDNYDQFMDINYAPELFYATTKAKKTYVDVCYSDNVFILFGKESKGIPEDMLEGNYDRCVRVPMVKEKRSLNLSNAVAVVVYEALRQNDFFLLEKEGTLHGNN